MITSTSHHELVIDAPDGPAALALEFRLAHLSPVTFAHGDRWTVEVPATISPAEVEAAVCEWLGEIGLDSTTMRVDDVPTRVEVSTAGSRVGAAR